MSASQMKLLCSPNAGQILERTLEHLLCSFQWRHKCEFISSIFSVCRPLTSYGTRAPPKKSIGVRCPSIELVPIYPLVPNNACHCLWCPQSQAPNKKSVCHTITTVNFELTDSFCTCNYNVFSVSLCTSQRDIAVGLSDCLSVYSSFQFFWVNIEVFVII